MCLCACMCYTGCWFHIQHDQHSFKPCIPQRFTYVIEIIRVSARGGRCLHASKFTTSDMISEACQNIIILCWVGICDTSSYWKCCVVLRLHLSCITTSSQEWITWLTYVRHITGAFCFAFPTKRGVQLHVQGRGASVCMRL